MVKRYGELGLFMAAPIKVAASTASATFLGRRHGELSFRMASLRRGWCSHRGIIFSDHFSVLSWLDPTERLVRINLSPNLMSISLGLDRLGSVSLLHRWQKEEEERRKKEEDYARSSLQGCWSPFFGHVFSACLLNVCPCGILFNFLHRFGFEIEFWNSLVREYFESAYNLMMYSALI